MRKVRIYAKKHVLVIYVQQNKQYTIFMDAIRYLNSSVFFLLSLFSLDIVHQRTIDRIYSQRNVPTN